MKHCIYFILSAAFLLNLNGREKEKNDMSATGISQNKHVSLLFLLSYCLRWL